LRPRDKRLGGALEPTPVDELGERGGCGRTSLAAKRSERGEDRLRFIEVDVANFAAVAPMPAEGGAAELVGPLRAEEEAEFKRLDETDRRKLGGRCKSLREVVPVERTPKASVRGRLRRHEHMFARSLLEDRSVVALGDAGRAARVRA
jgi:hypothetical protein